MWIIYLEPGKRFFLLKGRAKCRTLRYLLVGESTWRHLSLQSHIRRDMLFAETDVLGQVFLFTDWRIWRHLLQNNFCWSIFLYRIIYMDTSSFPNGIHENIFRRTCIGNGDVFSPKMTHTDIFADGMTYVTCFRAQPLWGYLFIPKGVRADIFSCKITYSEGSFCTRWRTCSFFYLETHFRVMSCHLTC